VTGDVITLDGAALADADGAAADVYLSYYEPDAPTGIDNPQTGLEGSFSIDTLAASDCLRSATISLTNNHELVDYCFGTDALDGPLFVPGGRLEVSVSVELNLNHGLVEMLQKVKQFSGNDIDIVLGDAAGRHLKVDLPRTIFTVPGIETPESGSVPVTFEGLGYQTSLDAADEVTVSYL
jgi:hypothetical protein